MDTHQLMTIFWEIDDFCKEFEHYRQNRLLTGLTQGHCGPTCALAMSKIMTILVMFQMTKFRHFKAFYNGFLCHYWCAAYFSKITLLCALCYLNQTSYFRFNLVYSVTQWKAHRHLLH